MSVASRTGTLIGAALPTLLPEELTPSNVHELRDPQTAGGNAFSFNTLRRQRVKHQFIPFARAAGCDTLRFCRWNGSGVSNDDSTKPSVTVFRAWIAGRNGTGTFD